MKFLILLLFTSSVFAQSIKTQVLFFGGVGFKKEYTEIFSQQVQTATPIGLNYVFDSIAYPSPKPLYAEAIKSGSRIIKKYAKQINSDPEVKYILVGHSSGSALTIEIAKKIINLKNVSMIVLDGFLPPQALQEKMNIFCWGAFSDSDLSIESTNYSLMKTCKQFREYPSKVCKSPACLHFSLIEINKNVTSYSELNFAKLTPNLEWLSP